MTSPFPTISTSLATVTPPAVAGTRRALLSPIPGEPGEFLMVIDNSSLEKFTTCPKSSEFYLIDGREAHARNSALVFGGAIHAAMEELEWGRDASIQDQRIVDFFANNPTPPGDYRTVNVALQVMKHYRQRLEWAFPDLKPWLGLADANGKQIVEQAFEIPLGVIEVNAPIDMPWLTQEESIGQQRVHTTMEPPATAIHVRHIHIAWSGRIDRVAHTNSIDRVCDHKTTSIAGNQITDEYHLSNPMLGYTWAGRKLYPHLNIQGACINFIHLKKPGVSGYGADLTAKGSRGGEPPLSFFRAYYEYSDERLAWWESNVLAICGDFISNLVRGYFPSHTKSCIGKYGKCQYWDVCVNDSLAVQQSLIKSDLFRQVTWNPTAERA